MSRSIHTTYKDLKGLTKSELEDMAKDSDTILNDLAEKRAIKKKVKQDRKINNDATTCGIKNWGVSGLRTRCHAFAQLTVDKFLRRPSPTFHTADR